MIFRGISVTHEAVSKYYGGPKPTKKYVPSDNNLKKQQVYQYVPSSQPSRLDYGNYSDIVKNNAKTESSTILPKSYDRLKDGGYIYYQGKLLNEYQLVEEAVKTKAITLDESMNYSRALAAASKALIVDRATPKYRWSNTLYSEDGMYVIKVDEKGVRCGFTSTLIDGVHISDVAARMASGELNENIETLYLNYLRQVDPELYEAATNIGREIRNFTIMSDLYKEGSITEMQFEYDCMLLAYLFSRDGEDSSYMSIFNYFKKIQSCGDWYKLLENYSPEGFAKLDAERQETYRSFGGII